MSLVTPFHWLQPRPLRASTRGTTYYCLVFAGTLAVLRRGVGWPVVGIFVAMAFAAAAIAPLRRLQVVLLTIGLVGLAWIPAKYLPIVLLWPTHSYWIRMLISVALASVALAALLQQDREMMEPIAPY